MEHVYKKRKPYPSADQKQKLIELVQADPELYSGKYSSTFTKKEGENRWQIIAKECNALNGAYKEWDEWRKTWQDMKNKTKKKQSAIRRATNLTGGGPPPDPLDLVETQILCTLSDSAISGHADSQESQVNLIISDMEQENMPPAASPSSETLLAADQQQSAGPSHINDFEYVDETPNFASQNKRRRTVSQKRLSRSLDVAQNLEAILKEKNDIKKQFYKEFISEMRQQTQALSQIARSLRKNNNIDHDYA